MTRISCNSYFVLATSTICTIYFPDLYVAWAKVSTSVTVEDAIVVVPSDAADSVNVRGVTVTQLKFPAPSVLNNCPDEPSADGYFNPDNET
mgnify:CR=1 FL=1